MRPGKLHSSSQSAELQRPGQQGHNAPLNHGNGSSEGAMQSSSSLTVKVLANRSSIHQRRMYSNNRSRPSTKPHSSSSKLDYLRLHQASKPFKRRGSSSSSLRSS